MPSFVMLRVVRVLSVSAIKPTVDAVARPILLQSSHSYLFSLENVSSFSIRLTLLGVIKLFFSSSLTILENSY